MKSLFMFSALLIFFSGQVNATCTINGTAKRANFSMPANVNIPTDPTIPVGSILYTKLMGIGGNTVPGFSCDGSSKNRYTTVITANEVPGVTGVMGKPVYETGIPGIGFQVSDLISGKITAMTPAVAGSIPVPGSSKNSLYRYWLIKTGPINLDIAPVNSTVSFYVADSDAKATLPASLLLALTMKFSSPVARQNSCEITSTKTVNLAKIDKAMLLASSPGSKTPKEQPFSLSVQCDQESAGNTVYYWFNPRSNIDGSPGVLLNSNPESSGGAKNVGIIIKENNSPIEFYDYEAKSFKVDANNLTKNINLTADYYRSTDDISAGSVRGLLEVVIQEE